MLATLQPICGVQLGIELTEAEVEDKVISYILIDLLILRIQIAWFKE
jgi:hypothetical protein